MKLSPRHILKSRISVRNSHAGNRDDGNSRVAEYESLLDLFTLISFILLFAALLYVGKFEETGQATSDVAAQIAQNASGPAKSLPKDLLLLVLHREENSATLSVVGGKAGVRADYLITEENVVDKLNEIKSVISSSAKVELAFQEPKEAEDAFIIVKIENWLGSNGCNFTLLFFGK